MNEEIQYSMGIQYAKSRVNSARNKLYGINPCVVTRDDLMSGIHKESKYLKHFVDVVTGVRVVDTESNFVLERTRLLKEKGEKYRLSVEEQVRCIIEQSTDSNILGRTWVGWKPYI
jgi:DNA-dependent protein kinase catalytic subunit